MSGDKQKFFERKKKRYKTVYKREVPFRKIKGIPSQQSGSKRKRKKRK
jgi:hypothetical protein